MLHFPPEEFSHRVSAMRARMRKEGLDALLVFAQESHYYLTGYDTGGYKQFQVAVFGVDDAEPTLLTRHPDRQQAYLTSTYTDVRIWLDANDANPANDLKAMLDERGLRGARIGVERLTLGLNAYNWDLVRNALEGWCTLVDASGLVQTLRAVKSPLELQFVRKAAAIADDVIRAVAASAGPDVDETEVELAAHTAVLRGGGDVNGARVIFGSGPKAVLLRAPTGSRRMAAGEQLAVEWAGIYRRYHAGIYRTFAIGAERPEHLAIFTVVRDALAAMTDAARPGTALGEIDSAQRRVMDAAKYTAQRISSSGYSVGATFPPRGLPDTPPLLFAGNPMLAEPGMTLFLHAIFADGETGDAMMLGHTLLITETGCEVLSALPVEYLVCA